MARTLAVGEAGPVDPSAQGTRLTFLGLVLAPGALCVKQISGARLVPTYTRLLDGGKLDGGLSQIFSGYPHALVDFHTGWCVPMIMPFVLISST